MRYKYDPKTDILLMIIKNGMPDFGKRSGNIITHYNKRGIPIEIEILDASKTIMKTLLKGRKLVSKER
ncbi:MAG: DUF2283 domain-containing protein [Candidatus Micrarchaeota archaeon]|nr:DUF2283 domain-containing protein [Candidatus Micrarchaeota archaeon]